MLTPFDAALPIVKTLVHEALVTGYNVSVFDSEEWSTRYSYNKSEIIQDIFGVEEALLSFHTHDRKEIGQVFLLLDNGEDVIVDYTDDNDGPMNTLMNYVIQLTRPDN